LRKKGDIRVLLADNIAGIGTTFTKEMSIFKKGTTYQLPERNTSTQTMTDKEPEEVILEENSRENLQYEADIDTLKNFMQKLEDKESLDKFFIQKGVISLYQQLREEITPPRDIEEAWRRILITDSWDHENSCGCIYSSDNTDLME
jgi:hypothetical protein